MSKKKSKKNRKKKGVLLSPILTAVISITLTLVALGGVAHFLGLVGPVYGEATARNSAEALAYASSCVASPNPSVTITHVTEGGIFNIVEGEEDSEEPKTLSCQEVQNFGDVKVRCSGDPSTSPGTGRTCRVEGFSLPQPNAESMFQSMQAVGDPNFLVYYESYPEEEQTPWIVQEDNFLVPMVIIGGVANVLPFAGKKAIGGIKKVGKKLFRSGSKEAVGEIGEKTAREIADKTLRDTLSGSAEGVIRRKAKAGSKATLGEATEEYLKKNSKASLRKLIKKSIKVELASTSDDFATQIKRPFKDTLQKSLNSEFSKMGIPSKIPVPTLTDKVSGETVDILTKNWDNVGEMETLVKNGIKNSLHQSTGLSDDAIDDIAKASYKSMDDSFYRQTSKYLSGGGLEEFSEKTIKYTSNAAYRAARSRRMINYALDEIGDFSLKAKTIARVTSVTGRLKGAGRKALNVLEGAPESYRNRMLKNSKKMVQFFWDHPTSTYLTISYMEEGGVIPEDLRAVSTFAKCDALTSGFTKRKSRILTCAAIVASGVISKAADEHNTELQSVDINGIGFKNTPRGRREWFVMDESVEPYYVEMRKTDDASEYELRFSMASPCKTDLIVYKEKTSCFWGGLDESIEDMMHDYDPANPPGEPLKKVTLNSHEWYMYGMGNDDLKQPFLVGNFFNSTQIDIAIEEGKVPKGTSDKSLRATKLCPKPGMWDNIIYFISPFLANPSQDSMEVVSIRVEPANVEGFCYAATGWEEISARGLLFAGEMAIDAIILAGTGPGVVVGSFIVGATAAYIEEGIGADWPAHTWTWSKGIEDLTGWFGNLPWF